MSISTFLQNITYNDEIENLIFASGGTIVFMKDNVIVATEVSEAQYRELLNNPYISKIDVLPLKRYKNEGIKYTESGFEDFVNSTGVQNITNNL